MIAAYRTRSNSSKEQGFAACTPSSPPHVLLVGAWPELVHQFVGRPARFSLLQLPGVAGAAESALAYRCVLFAQETHLPVVVKPAVGSGSKGVSAVYEIRRPGRRLPAAKRTTGQPHFVETGHILPADIDTATAKQLSAEALRALDAIGHHDGPCHVELILAQDGPAIVEINRRVSGDRIWELTMLALDRNVMAETLRHVLGAVRTVNPTRPGRAAAIRYLVPRRPVRWSASPDGTDVLAGIPGVVRSVVTAERQAAAIAATSSSTGRLGYVISVADTPAEAVEAADTGHDALAAGLFVEAYPTPESETAPLWY